MYFNSFSNFIKAYRGVLIILLSIFLGVSVGIVFGEKADIFMPLGDIFLNLTFTIVTPLIFFSVSSSIANIITLRSTKKTLLYSFITFILMSLVATLFMLICVKVFHPIKVSSIELPKNISVNKIDVIANFASMFTASDFSALQSRNSILALIVFSCMVGLSVKLLNEKSDLAKSALSIGASVMYKMIDILMYYAPIGLFACFAAYFGNSGKSLLDPMIRTVAIFYIASTVFIAVFYLTYVYISAGMQGIRSLKYLLVPTTVALATQSSLATLPYNFEAAKDMNIPPSIYNLTLPLGSIIHLDGSSISTVLKIAFLYSIFGMPMTGFDFYGGIFIFAILISLLSSGIPGGGLILETSLIAFYNLPGGILPVLLLLNYIIDPMVTVINSNGNILASMIISRIIKGDGWIFREEIEEDDALKIYK